MPPSSIKLTTNLSCNSPSQYFYILRAMTIISALFLDFLCTTTTAFNPPHASDDLSIIHVYGKGLPLAKTKSSSSMFNTVSKLVSNDLTRISYLSSLKTSKNREDSDNLVPIAPGNQVVSFGDYLVRLKFGTPGQPMFVVLDTSNDIAWIPCSGCQGCPSTTMFSPNTSSAYGTMDCSSTECNKMVVPLCTIPGTTTCLFNQSYAEDSLFVATLSHDSLKLGSDVILNYAFGCINNVPGTSMPPQGLLGLGRGPMPLMSQTKKLYSGIFSYCLPSLRSFYFSGSLKFGPNGQPKAMPTTPLLKNSLRPTLYYVNLLAVSVGDVQIPIPKDDSSSSSNNVTGAGTIIDSGTAISRFVHPVYSAIRVEIKQQVKGPFSSLGSFDTGFTVTYDFELPIITILFEGMDLELPLENTYLHSSPGSNACLAMAASPTNANFNLNVIDNFQQPNMRTMIDNDKSQLGMVDLGVLCDSPK